MDCRNCGKKVNKDNKYCNYCGSELSSKLEVANISEKLETETIKNKCPNCLTINLDEAKYCKKCGEALNEKKVYAGFWVRLGAYLIDYAGVMFLALLIMLILTFFGYDVTHIESSTDIVFTYFCIVIYFGILTALLSTTPGKKIYGLSLSKEDGDSMDWSTSFKRAALQPFSGFLFLSGYSGMNKSGKQQAWHDKKCHTVVLKEKNINYIIPAILSVLGFVLYVYIRSLPSS